MFCARSFPKYLFAVLLPCSWWPKFLSFHVPCAFPAEPEDEDCPVESAESLANTVELKSWEVEYRKFVGLKDCGEETRKNYERAANVYRGRESEPKDSTTLPIRLPTPFYHPLPPPEEKEKGSGR